MFGVSEVFMKRPVYNNGRIDPIATQAVDKGRVVVYDADYKSCDPIKINAAAKPACLALTREGQVSY